MRSIGLILSSLALGGCGTLWLKPQPREPEPEPIVCESLQEFQAFANCAKATLRSDSPSASERAYLSQLRSIEEDFQAGKLTDIKARAAADLAYLNTIDKADEAKRNRDAMRRSGGTVVVPIHTPMTCTRFGNIINCY